MGAHTHTHSLGTAMATKLHCKYAQNDRSDREAQELGNVARLAEPGWPIKALGKAKS